MKIDADDCTFANVKVVGAGEHGITVAGTGNLVEGCSVIRTKDTAYKARTAGNTFKNNKAKKSRDLDLDDDAGQGGNVYENNKFDPDKVDADFDL